MNIFQTSKHNLNIPLSSSLNSPTTSTVDINFDQTNTDLYLPFELTLDFRGVNLSYPSHLFIDWDPERLQTNSEGKIELVTQFTELVIKKQIQLSRYNIDTQNGNPTMPIKITIIRITYNSFQQEIKKQININIRSKIYQLGQLNLDSVLGQFTLLKTHFIPHTNLLLHWYETVQPHLIIPVLIDTTKIS